MGRFPWFTTKVKQILFLWLEGFLEACCLHRVFILCRRSKQLSIRTGQCFLLNGFIFLGSLFLLNSVVIPTLLWILPDKCSEISSGEQCSFDGILKYYSFLRHGLMQLVYIFWFYPLYLFSFILSTLWYNDIAKYGFAAMGESGSNLLKPSSSDEVTVSENKAPMNKLPGLEGVIVGIGEQVYSALLLTFFFLQVSVVGLMPFVGKTFSFVLLSWMYAYYCFEYKWNLSEVPLDRRLDFFETNWAFFAGFGSPCVLAIFFVSPLVSYGVMAILYPLFVLAATSSSAEQLILLERKKWKGVGLGRLPIFCVADTLSLRILSFLPLESRQEQANKKPN
ncbi:Protein EI24 homolog [Linum perenne]